jgi:hypothetical protein
VQQLPDAVRASVVDAYAEALAPIFSYLAPLFLVGLILVAFIPASPLRTEIDSDPAEAPRHPHPSRSTVQEDRS